MTGRDIAFYLHQAINMKIHTNCNNLTIVRQEVGEIDGLFMCGDRAVCKLYPLLTCAIS